jgi:hypothetical protein
MLKLNQQLHEIMIMLKQTIGHQGDTDEPRIKSPPRKRRGKNDINFVSSNEKRFGSWASELESDEEKKMPGNKGSRGYQRHGGGVWDITKHVTPIHKQRLLGDKGNMEDRGWYGTGNTN